jgi:ATP-dependent Lon protease
MAAHRNGIKNIILPKQNKKDIKDIPEDLRGQLKIYFAENIWTYLELALEKKIDQQFFDDQRSNRGMKIIEPKL